MVLPRGVYGERGRDFERGMPLLTFRGILTANGLRRDLSHNRKDHSNSDRRIEGD